MRQQKEHWRVRPSEEEGLENRQMRWDIHGRTLPKSKRLKLDSAGEMKLSNEFVQMENENNSEARKKGREATPQRQNDKTVETARIETPRGIMRRGKKDRLIFRQAGEEIPLHHYDVSVHDGRQVP